MPPALLISVRDLEEASVAERARVSIIDFKEPRNGALSPVHPEVWLQAAAQLPGVTLSAALGESETAFEVAEQVPGSFSFAKVGPSGVGSRTQLIDLWMELPIPPSVQLVPVAYADHESADCLNPHDVLDAVIQSGRSHLLIDTFTKDGQRLMDHLSPSALLSLRRHASEAGVWLALAGSIRQADVLKLAEEGIVPDCFGVRGDVCDDSRTGKINMKRVGDWQKTCTSLQGLSHSGT